MIVTGTLLRAGSEVRVATQLTDASSGTLLWSKPPKRRSATCFALQDELTQRIVTSLSLPLTNREQSLLQRDVPASPKPTSTFSAAIS